MCQTPKHAGPFSDGRNCLAQIPAVALGAVSVIGVGRSDSGSLLCAHRIYGRACRDFLNRQRVARRRSTCRAELVFHVKDGKTRRR